MGKITLRPSPFTKNPEPNIMMNINIIQSALQSLKVERAHIEEYLQNAAEKNRILGTDLP